MTEPLKVGDVGVVIEHHRPHRREATIVKVGRKWATVEPGWLGRFNIETGEQDGGKYSSCATFYTTERLAKRDELIEAGRVIREAGLERRFSVRWQPDDVVALAHWLVDRFVIESTL